MTLLDNEVLQEKNEQIEILQEQLAKEKDKLHGYEKKVSDLTEELSILSAKF